MASQILQQQVLQPSVSRGMPSRLTKREHPLDVIISWLEKSICRGAILEALYCAAEIDLSGWSLLLWERLIWIGWAHIGLANPLVPMALLDLHQRWLESLEEAGQCPLERSYECEKAKCIVLLTVSWLAKEKKNQLVLHCSAATIMETTGCLTDDDWLQSLGTNTALKTELKPVRLQNHPAESKAIVCLCRSMIENDEDRAVRMVNLLHIWKKSELVWFAAERLCEVDSYQMFAWAKDFVQSYKKVWEFSRDTRRQLRPLWPQQQQHIGENSEENGEEKEEAEDTDLEPQRLPLIQIILLMIPARNHRFMFPSGVRSTRLSEDKIRQWKDQTVDIYSEKHKKLVPPDWAHDKNTVTGKTQGKKVEDYLHSGLRVTNFLIVPDPFSYYDRSHQAFVEAEKRYKENHTTYDALERLKKHGAVAAGNLQTPPQSDQPEITMVGQPSATYAKAEKTAPVPSSSPPLNNQKKEKKRKRSPMSLSGSSSNSSSETDSPVSKRRRQMLLPETRAQEEEEVCVSLVTTTAVGQCVEYGGKKVLIDGPFSNSSDNDISTITKHVQAIGILKQLCIGMDAKEGGQDRHSLFSLAPTVKSLQLSPSFHGVFVMVDNPQLSSALVANGVCPPQKSAGELNGDDDDDDDAINNSDEEMFLVDGIDDCDSSNSSGHAIVPVTPEVMQNEDRLDVHIRFLSALVFRAALGIRCEDELWPDFLIDKHRGNIYSMRERRMSSAHSSRNRSAQKIFPLLRGGSKRWSAYIEREVQHAAVFNVVRERCLRWKRVLEVPAIQKRVFGDLPDVNPQECLKNLSALASGDLNIWQEMTMSS